MTIIRSEFTTKSGNKYIIGYGEVSQYGGTYDLAGVAEDYEKLVEAQTGLQDDHDAQEITVEAMRILLVYNRDMVSVERA